MVLPSQNPISSERLFLLLLVLRARTVPIFR